MSDLQGDPSTSALESDAPAPSSTGAIPERSTFLELLTLCEKMPPLPSSDIDIIRKLLAADASLSIQKAIIGKYIQQPVPALLVAINNDHAEVVQMLVSAGADVDAAVNELSQRYVHLAAISGNCGILKILLDAGVAFEEPDVNNQTALHFAAMHGHVDCVELLVVSGADIESKGFMSSTPLHMAAACGTPMAVKKLLEAGADPNALDGNGRTPMQSGNSDITAAFKSFVPSRSVTKLRNMLASDCANLDLCSLPSPCSISRAIQIAVAGHTRDSFANAHGEEADRKDLAMEFLSIANCALTSLGSRVITKDLRSLSSLISVDIHGNPELGVVAVAQMLDALPASVTTLNIGNTGIQIVSQRFTPCFLKFSALTNLDISENANLSNRDISLLLHDVSTTLKVLSLRRLRLNMNSVKSLEVSFSRLYQLEDLNLSENYSAAGDTFCFGKFDRVFDICGRCFPRLHTLNVSNVPSLCNVPPTVSLLCNLRILKLNGCDHLASLPDEMEEMLREDHLISVEIIGSKKLEFPPYKIATQGCQEIKKYIKNAKNAQPLKKCKVVFLGNGRIGKTSLLRSLADQTLNPDEVSTQGVSTSHNLGDRIKPTGLMAKFAATFQYPELIWWDFAGQLEYSAAHDFFMSNCQAVYVIVFSAVDDRESQVHQVTFWLRTVLSRNASLDFSRIRVVIVGTKIDSIKPDRLDHERQEIEGVMHRAFDSVIKRFASSKAPFSWSVSVKFVTAYGAKNQEYQNLRNNLKDHIFKLSAEIFDPRRGRLMRFPKEYTEISSDIRKLQKKFKTCGVVPIINLSDESIVTPEYKTLFGSHSNSMKLQALQILSDVGEIMFYTVEGNPWICVQPQLFANAIALFADPSSPIKDVSSRKEILAELDKLEGIAKDENTRQKLFDSLMALKLVILQSEVGSSNRSDFTRASSVSAENLHYLIPLALKGRPIYWRDIIDVRAIRAIRGLRFTAQHMVSVATFLRVMCDICSLRQHMWGCAFFFPFNDAVNIFIRLSESRCSVDCIVLGPSGELSSPEIEARCHLLASQLGCDTHSRSFLCPQCCQTDAFLRIGSAHAFFLQESEYSSNRLLNCSRCHTPSVEGVKCGVDVSMSDTAKIVLTDDTLRSQLPWAKVVTGAGILRGSMKMISQRTTYDGHITYSDDASLDLSSVDSDSVETERLNFKGTLLPNSFFVLTKQLRADDVLEDTSCLSLCTLLDGSKMEQECPVRVLRRNGSTIIVAEHRLKLVYSSGDRISDIVDLQPVVKEIDLILSLTRASIINDVEEQHDGTLLLSTTTPHHLDAGSNCSSALLSFNFHDGGGRICQVVRSVSPCQVIVQLNLHEDEIIPSVLGVTILPCQPSFGANDHVLVTYKRLKGKFDLFPGKIKASASSKELELKMCELTSADCRGNIAVAECWRDVQNHWEVMLGTESKNYEMTRITMFRNPTRERLFDLELENLKAASRVNYAPRGRVTEWSVAAQQVFPGRWDAASGKSPPSLAEWKKAVDGIFTEGWDTGTLASASSHACGETSVLADPFMVAADILPEQKQKRRQLQDQVMGHFSEFSEKFCLQNKSENKDVNLSVAWWGKTPASYITTAQHGFFTLPANLKMDPGYFGDGFYLTQYPRYSDYYISGCSLSTRKVQEGNILLCYAALGRPYPVTQNPYKSGGGNEVPEWSLCGKHCGPQCGGADSHDCHYVTVKKDPESSQYYPCPLRQQPDFDEIVIFKSERILPVAFVSFQRRRKALLWLDDHPFSEDNLRIRSKIPGSQWFDEMEAFEQRHVVMKAGNSQRADGAAALHISGATGPYAGAVNGLYLPTSEVQCGRPVYRKKKEVVEDQGSGSDSTEESNDMLIVYSILRQEWQVKDDAHRHNEGWALASLATPGPLEHCVKFCTWRVVSVLPKLGRVSLSLNRAATAPKAESSLKLEDGEAVDVTLFTSVAAIVSFLSEAKNAKFAKYPPSLFRIITNRRLFIGSVRVTVFSESEFKCQGILALRSLGDRIVFEGQRRWGGVEDGVGYYLAAVRKSGGFEYFSVSKEKGGAILTLQKEPDSLPMFVRAPLHSLSHFFETSDAWRLSFPATCVYPEEMDDHTPSLQGRPNFVNTNAKTDKDCDMFVAFEPLALLQERDLT